MYSTRRLHYLFVFVLCCIPIKAQAELRQTTSLQQGLQTTQKESTITLRRLKKLKRVLTVTDKLLGIPAKVAKVLTKVDKGLKTSILVTNPLVAVPKVNVVAKPINRSLRVAYQKLHPLTVKSQRFAVKIEPTHKRVKKLLKRTKQAIKVLTGLQLVLKKSIPIVNRSAQCVRSMPNGKPKKRASKQLEFFSASLNPSVQGLNRGFILINHSHKKLLQYLQNLGLAGKAFSVLQASLTPLDLVLDKLAPLLQGLQQALNEKISIPYGVKIRVPHRQLQTYYRTIRRPVRERYRKIISVRKRVRYYANVTQRYYANVRKRVPVRYRQFFTQRVPFRVKFRVKDWYKPWKWRWKWKCCKTQWRNVRKWRWAHKYVWKNVRQLKTRVIRVPRYRTQVVKQATWAFRTVIKTYKVQAKRYITVYKEVTKHTKNYTFTVGRILRGVNAGIKVVNDKLMKAAKKVVGPWLQKLALPIPMPHGVKQAIQGIRIAQGALLQIPAQLQAQSHLLASLQQKLPGVSKKLARFPVLCGGRGAVSKRPAVPSRRGCRYARRFYQDGQLFRANDRCNTCRCTRGRVTCSRRRCPRPCRYRGRFYPPGIAVRISKTLRCTCINGRMTCRPMKQPHCRMGSRVYRNGQRFRLGLRLCVCSKGKLSCKRVSYCRVGPRTYRNGQRFRLGYRQCTCVNGRPLCKSARYCKMGRRIYRSGQTFRRGSLLCTCKNRAIRCHRPTTCAYGRRTYPNGGSVRVGTSICRCVRGSWRCSRNRGKYCRIAGRSLRSGQAHRFGSRLCTCLAGKLRCR